MGVERKINALLNTALHLCDWSPSSCCQFTNSTHSTEGWAGLRSGVTTAEKRRITARLQSPIITALTRLSQLHTIIWYKKVKWSHYRPGVAQRVGRGIALLFHDWGTRRGLAVSSTLWLHFTPGKNPVPILQEAGWAPGLVWTGGKSCPHWDSIPDHPGCSQSLYRLSYPE